MNWLLYSLSLTCLIVFVKAREVCYDDLGCFNDNYPFSGTLQRPIAFLPDSPERISVKFTLFSRRFPNGVIVTHDRLGNQFDPSLNTKFIIHGFLQHGNKSWVLELRDALLRVENINLITVDWSKGNGFPYTQAVANSQIVGAEIARLIKSYVKAKNVKAQSFHLIGHSLGAHICGYAGKRLEGLGRITGLDPAGPAFEFTDPIVRLDSSDAKFVDIIHTDGTSSLQLGLGLMQPIGHVDFYPNGGKDQPNCPDTPGKLLAAIFNIVTVDYEGLEDSLGCSHVSAINFFVESLNNNDCQYTGYKCQSIADFNKGHCLKCSNKGCNRMGYYASQDNDLGQLFLSTQPLDRNKYCKQHYLVKLYSDNLSTQAKGKFTIKLFNGEQLSSIEVLDDSDTTFKKNSVEIRLISLDRSLNIDLALQSAYLTYYKTKNIITSWMYSNEWRFKYIEVFSGDNQFEYKLCPLIYMIQSGRTVEFVNC